MIKCSDIINVEELSKAQRQAMNIIEMYLAKLEKMNADEREVITVMLKLASMTITVCNTEEMKK